ncbi:MAG: hypothetical protein KGJ62_06925 [Armatimonadetes bacterium]|nr:hypothetical protein [Armatimonadota bacterium]MDE2206268.1 hypothetical protein [Armatimonadota bacterium]
MPLYTQFVYYLERAKRHQRWRRAALPALAGGLILLLAGCSTTAPLHPLPKVAGVVVVLIPGWSSTTASRSPAWASLMKTAAFGVVAIRTADRTPTSSPQRLNAIGITLGAGSRAAAPPHLWLAGTAQAASTIQRINDRLDHPVVAGRLGDEVRAAGGVVESIGSGSADDGCEPGLLMAIDGAGECVVAAPPVRGEAAATWPFGIRDDSHAILVSLNHALASARLVVITLGDLYRADRYADRCLPRQAAAQHAAAVRAVDRAIGQINAQVRSAKEPHALIVIGLPDRAAPDPASRLGVCAVSAPNSQAARLVSASTHRSGVLTVTDIEPALAAMLNLNQASPLRLAAAGRHHGRPTATTAFWANVIEESRAADLLGGWPILQAVLLLTAALLPSGSRVARTALLMVLWMPLSSILLPQAGFGSPPVCATLFAAATVAAAVFSLCAVERFGLRNTIVALLAVTTLVIFIDLITGAHLMQRAWMSYTITEGARFYGIGNEMMGTAIGAGCALIQFWRFETVTRRTNALIPGLAYSGAAALSTAMALPIMGAKAGAAPTGCIALFAFLGSMRSGKGAWKGAAFGALAGGLLLVAAVKLDSAASAVSRTHIARAASQHYSTIMRIAVRKLAMEGWLVLHSVWTLELLAAGVAISLLRRRSHRTGWFLPLPLAIAAAAALLLNDSGISAAALILAFGVAPEYVAAAALVEPR